MKLKLTPVLALMSAGFYALSVSCGSSSDPADHDHDHDHDHEDHAEHGDHEEHAGHAEKDGHEEHAGHEGHADRKDGGPNGGRILGFAEPHLEFLVTEDRKVRIFALNDAHEAVPTGDLDVRVIGGDRTNPTDLSFAKDGDTLISDGAFPEGNDFPVVVRVTPAGGETVTEKFNLNLNDCPSCDYPEYACICDHDHE